MNWALKALLGGIGVGIVLMAIFGLIAAIPTYLLWNWLMPTILGVKAVTFLQAWGINFLTAILFKSNISVKKEA